MGGDTAEMGSRGGLGAKGSKGGGTTRDGE
jgi:hypothetical protein